MSTVKTQLTESNKNVKECIVLVWNTNADMGEIAGVFKNEKIMNAKLKIIAASIGTTLESLKADFYIYRAPINSIYPL